MHIENIVIVCDYAYFEGGAANVAMQSVIALAKYSNSNVYCFAGNGKPCEELINSGAKVISLDLPDLLGNKNKIDAMLKGIYNLKAYSELKKLLKTLDPSTTIVHVHTWTKVLSSSVFKVCEQLRFRVYLTLHEYFTTCPNGACYNYVNQKICELKPLSWKCIKCNCDSRNYLQKLWRCARQVVQNSVIRHNKNIHYIFISNYQKQQIKRRVPKIEHEHLVKNPIKVIERLHISPEKNDIYIYIGRLTAEKGPELFCKAVMKTGVKAVVLGDGILKDELKQKYDNIEFVGWQSRRQIDEWLKKTRALVFPTLWYEGSPLTIPEVQAHGIPCIVTDCSSGTDDIVHGKNGEIVKPSEDEIAGAIRRFEKDAYIKKLSEETYRMYDETRSDERAYVEALMQVYNMG